MAVAKPLHRRAAVHTPEAVFVLASKGTYPLRLLRWAAAALRMTIMQLESRLQCCAGHVLRFFDSTNLVTQLPDAYNYKPYW